MPGLLLVFVLTSGCSVAYYRQSADLEVNSILREKEKLLHPVSAALPRFNGETAPETRILNLKEVLITAAKNNREYQSRKEDVYLKALDLTGARFVYRWRWDTSGGLEYNKEDEHSWATSSSLRLVRWLADGAQITFNLSKDFLQYLTGDKSKSFQSMMQLDLLQPLLKGAGRKVAQENLTQVERDVVYAMRSFLRYQRSFSVDVAQQYFQILLAQDTLTNYWANYLFLSQTRQRIEMMAEAGRLPPLQADQARQNELQAYQDWLRASHDYQSRLDTFRTLLAIPLNQPVVLDKEVLIRLLNQGVSEPSLREEECLQAALTGRLDLLTAADELEDAKRKVAVARDNLHSYLALKLHLETSSDQTEHPTWRLSQPDYSGGLDFSFPFSRVEERNAYQRSLINLERARRQFFLKRDIVTAEVAESYRALEEAYRTYQIQKSSLALAQRRVESTDLLLQAGRATTRDLLEAQEALTRARNALSAAVVNYQISYLRLLRDAELLELDEAGVWKGDTYEKTIR